MRSRFGSAFYFFCLRSLQGLFQVGQDIVHILDAHGEAHQVGGHPGGGQLGVAHLAVGCLLYTSHVELATKSKIFCACTAAFGGAPNTHCCPVCTGMPGALPVLNGKVVEYAVRAALALGCTVTRYSRFDRKNYFYPDLPKACLLYTSWGCGSR